MKWHRFLSIVLTLLLMAGSVLTKEYSIIGCATSVEEGGSSGEGGSDSSSDGASSTGGNSHSSGSDSSSGGSSSSGSDSSSDGSSSSGSDSSSSGGSSSSDSSSSGESASSTADEAGNNSAHHSPGTNSSGVDTSSNTSSTPARDASSDEKIQEKKKAVRKKTEKDDANGRDYKYSELISSGNTSFTIVAISRNEEKIKKTTEELNKQLKSLSKREEELFAVIDPVEREVRAIKGIYRNLTKRYPDAENIDLYLNGCLRQAGYARKEDCLQGLDRQLSDIADRYHETMLKNWIAKYSVEQQAQAFQIDYMEKTEEREGSTIAYSNVSPVLKAIMLERENSVKEEKMEWQETRDKISDIRQHLNALEDEKNQTTIEIDERLLEYKELIPNPAIGFLNAVVAKEGCPYVWGASGPNAFDCSGLVSYGLRQCKAVGAGFRWTSQDYASHLRSIPFEEALPGDLVWKPGHISIYIDEDTVFEAPYTGSHVRFTSCNVSSRFRKVLRWWTEE